MDTRCFKPIQFPSSAPFQFRFSFADAIDIQALYRMRGTRFGALSGMESFHAVGVHIIVTTVSCHRMSSNVLQTPDSRHFLNSCLRSSTYCPARNRSEDIDDCFDDLDYVLFLGDVGEEKQIFENVSHARGRSTYSSLAKRKGSLPLQLNGKKLPSHPVEDSLAVLPKPGDKLVMRKPFPLLTKQKEDALPLSQFSVPSGTFHNMADMDNGSDGQQNVCPNLQALQRIEIVRLSDASFKQMTLKFELKPSSRSLIEYLFALGLKVGDIEKMLLRNKSSVMTDVEKVKYQLEFLVSSGVKYEDLSKLIVRHPKILGYSVQKMMQPVVRYLKLLELPDSKLGRIITLLPTLLESSPEKLLQPRIKYLVEVVGIKREDLSKVLGRSPQVLVQNLEASLEPRISFFLNELKLPKDALAKVITKHPQILHYSLEDNIRPHIKFLRKLGLSDVDIQKVVTRLAQVFSLSIENCLQPKVKYLFQELCCGIETLVSFPAFLSLSLEQRIMPRHKFLVERKRLPPGRFPMRCLISTDEFFCKHEAVSTIEEYYLFRQQLLLANFAKAVGRKHSLESLKVPALDTIDL